ncbi:hypothetical protein CFB89_29580 [Burkholderia sp. AU16741]|uniref:hypothetical protein n=1 Tax=Burkholderia sp. AU16741 TaxID=2015347 RepID=UPI000B7A0464|nr:hypothetical protein [Burkholderia sp. AU16741]OXI28419.1 hypothetical protein CFB89_29580 [Burkholderia sp. AU16741]
MAKSEKASGSMLVASSIGSSAVDGCNAPRVQPFAVRVLCVWIITCCFFVVYRGEVLPSAAKIESTDRLAYYSDIHGMGALQAALVLTADRAAGFGVATRLQMPRIADAGRSGRGRRQTVRAQTISPASWLLHARAPMGRDGPVRMWGRLPAVDTIR